MTPLLLCNLLCLGATLAGVVVVALLLHLVERGTGRYVAHRFGWRAVLLTAWIGVPLHELGHLVVARLFGHRIIAWKLFDPDPVTGTLGYVRHGRTRDSLWQRAGDLPIAVAPLLSGGLALVLLLWWMLPGTALLGVLHDAADWGAGGTATAASLVDALRAFSVSLVGAIWHHASPWLPLQLYLAICVACHLAPSAADFNNALTGLLLSSVLLAGLALGAAAVGVSLATSLALLPALAALATAATLFQGLFVAGVSLLCRMDRRRRLLSTR